MNRDDIADIRRWLEKSDGIADARAFLGDRRMDALVEVILEMAAQLWVTRRRLAMLESTLVQTHTLAANSVEQHQPDPEEAAGLLAERENFVARIFRSLAELPDESTD